MASNTTSFESRQTILVEHVSGDRRPLAGRDRRRRRSRRLPQYEDQAAVTRTFVNHAHNDYLEIAAGDRRSRDLLLVGFFLWWGRRAAPVWRSAARRPLCAGGVDRFGGDADPQPGRLSAEDRGAQRDLGRLPRLDGAAARHAIGTGTRTCGRRRHLAI